MESSFRRNAPAPRLRLADVALVLMILVGGGLGLATVSDEPRHASTPVALLDSSPAPALSVDPSSWWMLSGNSTPLSAAWTGVPAGCQGDPLWYRWTIEGGFAEGTLANAAGPSTEFTSTSGSTGVADVEVRSVLLASCGEDRSVVNESALADISVVAPLRVQNVTVTPNPIVAGESANLSFRIVNGQPPYRVRIAWGDGDVLVYNATGPGVLSVSHRFGNGSFAPAVRVTDSAGFVANASTEENLSVSDGLAVSIVAPTTVAEVGVPVQFSGVIQDPPGEFGFTDSCTDTDSPASPAARESVARLNFTCTFAATGWAKVVFEVVPVEGGQPPVEAQLVEPVASPLELAVNPQASAGEVGIPTGLTARLSGGVPPFRLTWGGAGNSSVRTTTYYTDGGLVLPLNLSTPGKLVAVVNVTDGAGAWVEQNSTNLSADPPLKVSAGGASSVVPAGAAVNVSLSLTGGRSPFEWWVEPAVAPASETPTNGSLVSAGETSWNGTFTGEGYVAVSMLVVDEDGAEWSETLSAALVPVLRVTAHVNGSSESPGPGFSLDVSLEGGLPPIEVNLSWGAGASWNRTVGADGAYAWTVPTNDTGTLTILLTVSDRLGASWVQNLSVALPAPSPVPSPPTVPPSPSPSPGGSTPSGPSTGSLGLVVAGFAAAFGVLALTLFVWRRRRPARSSSRGRPNPRVVLRRPPSSSQRLPVRSEVYRGARAGRTRGQRGDGRRSGAPPDELELEVDRRGRRGAADQ